MADFTHENGPSKDSEKGNSPERISSKSGLEPLMIRSEEVKSETPVERVGDNDESGVLGPWKFAGRRAHVAAESRGQHGLGETKKGKTDVGYLGTSGRPSADVSWLDAAHSDES